MNHAPNKNWDCDLDPEEKENVSKSVKELYAMEVIVKSKFLI